MASVLKRKPAAPGRKPTAPKKPAQCRTKQTARSPAMRDDIERKRQQRLKEMELERTAMAKELGMDCDRMEDKSLPVKRKASPAEEKETPAKKKPTPAKKKSTVPEKPPGRRTRERVIHDLAENLEEAEKAGTARLRRMKTRMDYEARKKPTPAKKKLTPTKKKLTAPEEPPGGCAKQSAQMPAMSETERARLLRYLDDMSDQLKMLAEHPGRARLR